MKFVSPAGVKKVQTDMTPMIDVVFQLMVFFLFTFKIAPVEGEIGVNMPAITAGSSAQKQDVTIERVPIKLLAGNSGGLDQVMLGERFLGGGEQALRSLSQVLKDTYAGPGGVVNDVEVEVDADRQLRYHWVIRATNAIMYAGIDAINFRDPKIDPRHK
ncbi:biopolymer transporter ExbD [bacterium]|nr:biopolymer transporter ExbD [bacterium]